MTLLASDEFDRVGALGSNWSTLVGAFACDGDKASESGLPGVNNWALMSVLLDATNLGARRVQAKLVRGAEGDATAGIGTSPAGAEFGLIVRTAFNATTGVYTFIEVGWQSLPSAALFVRTRSTIVPTPFVPPGYVTTWAHTWDVGAAKILRVEYGGPSSLNSLSVYIDDALIGSTPLPGLITGTAVNKYGIFAARAVVAVSGSTAPAGAPTFDLFEVANFASAVSSEVAPTVAASPSLTALVLDSEGLIASAAAFPVTPDEVWDESHRWRTNAMRTDSGHLVRRAEGSRKRRTWGFAWSGTVAADVTAMLAWFAGLKGGVGVGTYTTPEGQTIYFFVSPSRLVVDPTGKKSRRIELTAVECFAT